MRTERQEELLREVISRRRPELAAVLDLLGKVSLTDEQREELRGVLADELCEAGLREDGEPNELGLRLDDLIGWLMDF